MTGAGVGRQVVRVAATSLAGVVGIVASFAVLGVHYAVAFDASLACPDLTTSAGATLHGTLPAGSTCTYGTGTGTDAVTRPAESVDLSFVRPWWSAVLAVLVIAAIIAGVLVVVRLLERWAASAPRRAPEVVIDLRAIEAEEQAARHRAEHDARNARDTLDARDPQDALEGGARRPVG